MAGIVGHKMHVFAIPGHFYGSYPDGGTLGYEVSLRGPAPKAEEEPKIDEFVLGIRGVPAASSILLY